VPRAPRIFQSGALASFMGVPSIIIISKRRHKMN
jgi:hypothetical protein